ncbi:MAG: aspartate kinase, partial [Nitrosopumilales archaeon CG15_BIG_FIL_POST_REV_8_21_14_020_33_23]
MTKLVVAKFGGSAIGIDGISIPLVIDRINDLKKDSKIIAVFSAPLTVQNGKKCSLTDVILEQGRNVEDGTKANLDVIRSCYQKITEFVNSKNKEDCQKSIDLFLKKAEEALDEALVKKEFANEVRSRSLAFSGEILISHVMNYILRSNGIKADAVSYDDWPIITDHNIESTNFLASKSRENLGKIAKLVDENEVVTIGGFIGKTPDGIITTYERGGSDRTAADLGILFHKEYETKIDFEKDSSVVSADPKIVETGLTEVDQLSYNEARLAGMFGMKILDPIAIKEIVENGVDMPIIVTNMKEPAKTTTIKRVPDSKNGHPIKIVTGKENCAIFKIETNSAQK